MSSPPKLTIDPNTVDISVAITLLYSRLPQLDKAFFTSIQQAYQEEFGVDKFTAYRALKNTGEDLCDTSWKFVLVATTSERLESSFRKGMYTEGVDIPDPDPDDRAGQN